MDYFKEFTSKLRISKRITCNFGIPGSFSFITALTLQKQVQSRSLKKEMMYTNIFVESM